MGCRGKRVSKFKASLLYTIELVPGLPELQRIPVSKNQKQKRKNKKKKTRKEKKNKTPAEACLTDSLIFYSHGTGSGRQGGWGRLRSRCGTKTNCNIVASETC